MNTVSPSRFIDLDGLFNFRDLGGYPTEDGRSVTWGLLYRSDSLHRLSPTGAASLHALGLATVLDLRTTGELAERAWTPPTAWTGHRLHLPLLADTPVWSALSPQEAADEDFAANHYRQISVEGAAALRAAVEALAAPGALPAAFYCAAGKDRAGVLAALVLRLLGVSAEIVADDYALSEVATARWEASLAAGKEDDTKTTWAYVPPRMLRADRATMLTFLRGIDADHGSIASFAGHLGLPDGSLDRLRAALLT